MECPIIREYNGYRPFKNQPKLSVQDISKIKVIAHLHSGTFQSRLNRETIYVTIHEYTVNSGKQEKERFKAMLKPLMRSHVVLDGWWHTDSDKVASVLITTVDPAEPEYDVSEVISVGSNTVDLSCPYGSITNSIAAGAPVQLGKELLNRGGVIYTEATERSFGRLVAISGLITIKSLCVQVALGIAAPTIRRYSANADPVVLMDAKPLAAPTLYEYVFRGERARGEEILELVHVLMDMHLRLKVSHNSLSLHELYIGPSGNVVIPYFDTITDRPPVNRDTGVSQHADYESIVHQMKALTSELRNQDADYDILSYIERLPMSLNSVYRRVNNPDPYMVVDQAYQLFMEDMAREYK